jgi:hypothetical protein
LSCGGWGDAARACGDLPGRSVIGRIADIARTPEMIRRPLIE